MPHTAMLEPVAVQVRQRDNVTVKAESVRFVFLNGVSNQPWHASSLLRWLTGHLRRAKIRHRGPNQCRHTFASQCLSNYGPKEWVARQLGHCDVTMINKHYGRWIPKDSRSMAGLVSQMLGFRSEAGENGLEKVDSAPKMPQNRFTK